MARVQNPIIGQAINQAGGMVFSVWKQLKVMRSKPLSVANPRTAAQQAVRRRMALLASSMREILNTIREGYVRFQSGTTQWAQFLKENYSTGTSDNGTVASLTVNALKFAKGTLLPADSFEVTDVTGQAITVAWDDNSGQPGAAATDRARFVLVNADGSAVAALDPTKTRTDGSAVLNAPDDIVAASALVYMYFVNVAGDDVSDSLLATT